MSIEINQNIQKDPHKSYIAFSEPNQPNIFFNSCFDSGNLHKVNRIFFDHYSIWTAVDAQGTTNEGYPKSWFYFQVGGFIDRTVTFSIHRIHFLWSISKKPHLYRPVCKIQTESSQGQWQRLSHPVTSLKINSEQQLVLKFDFTFTKQIKSVKFAFIYPYSYEQQRNDILKLKQLYQIDSDKQIFLKQYELIKTYQKRIVDMLIISSHQGKNGYQNIKYDQFMDCGQKIIKFRDNKPIIFISARVHPIQTPSSFTMNGIIKFLLDKQDLRAHLLRKYFVFILVPMLNPDGVSNGNCRMDQLNQNLNRFYKNPDPVKQPSCYAVRKLCEHYQKDKRMFMYLDLHAHPAHKGNFMFGNAIYDFIQQVQSQLFPKILSQNCINFQFQTCIFSRKHMKAKDRYEYMNKQGCGRVVFYKDFGIPHAYTLQCGYHLNTYNNTIQQEKNKDSKYMVKYKISKNGQKIYENYEKLLKEQIKQKQNNLIKNNQINDQNDIQSKDNIQQKQQQIKSKYQQNSQVQKIIKFDKRKSKIQQIKALRNTSKTYINDTRNQSFLKQKTINLTSFYQGYDIFKCTQSNIDNIQDSYYKQETVLYNIESYQNLGRNILITILDIFNKNPFSRSIDLNERRKQIAVKKSKLNRFRKQQAGINIKMKNIVQLIEQQIYSQWHKKNVFTHIDSSFIQKSIRNKNYQFMITRTSKGKVNQKLKTIQKQRKQMFVQVQMFKKSIQIQNQNYKCILDINTQGLKQQDVIARNTFLAKRLKVIKSLKQKKKTSKEANDQKQEKKKNLQLKLSLKQDSNLKLSLPSPFSQPYIQSNQQSKIVKNQLKSSSSKIIKANNEKMANIRSRTLIMHGNSTINHSQMHQLKK